MDRKRTSGDPDIADQDLARETQPVGVDGGPIAGNSPNPAQHDYAAESGFGQNGMSEGDIRKRAYEIWEAEDRPDGGHERHWLQAEKELRGGSSQGV